MNQEAKMFIFQEILLVRTRLDVPGGGTQMADIFHSNQVITGNYGKNQDFQPHNK